MSTVVSIVEGHGEVQALPVLLRQLRDLKTPGVFVNVPPPIRVPKDRFLNKPEEFARFVQLAVAKSGSFGWILILLDADDDCPAQKGNEILHRAQSIAPHARFSVVLANREFEAWFLAASSSLAGTRNFQPLSGDDLIDPESPRDAKGWLNARMGPQGYGAVIDQPAFAAKFDISMALTRSRSLRKLCSEWIKHVV